MYNFLKFSSLMLERLYWFFFSGLFDGHWLSLFTKYRITKQCFEFGLLCKSDLLCIRHLYTPVVFEYYKDNMIKTNRQTMEITFKIKYWHFKINTKFTMTLHNIRTDLQVVPIDKLIWSCVRNYWGKDRTSKITIININATTIQDLLILAGICFYVLSVLSLKESKKYTLAIYLCWTCFVTFKYQSLWVF